MKKRLEKELGEEIESYNELRSNGAGAALYEITFPNGEIRYIIEGETGEI